MSVVPFLDRLEAGQRLAGRLTSYVGCDDIVVLALPRGGVPVAFEIAAALHAPLDVFLVRKLGAPGHPELAMGAIAAGGGRVLSADVIAALGVSPALIEEVTAQEQAELERRDAAYTGNRVRPSLIGQKVIVVDDGLATGATMEAAIGALRQRGVDRIVVAAPVGARETCRRLAALADEVVCLETPEPFNAVGLWYRRFDQTSDEEVIELLQRAEQRRELMKRKPGHIVALTILAVSALLATACATTINKVLADPSRYRTREVKLSGSVAESVSLGGRGAYRLQDGTGQLWVMSEQGTPQKGARVSVKGTVVEAFNLGSLGDRINLPGVGGGIVLRETSHKAQD